MNSLSVVSSAAVAAGVPSRYRYWFGASGQRHLFTETEIAAICDFAEGVVIAIRGGSIIWTGEVCDFAVAPATPWMRGADLHVHLLAATPEARRAIIDDLRPAERAHLRLAA